MSLVEGYFVWWDCRRSLIYDKGIERQVGLFAGTSNPDDSLHGFKQFYGERLVRVIRIRKAIWSDDEGKMVVKATGKFPDDWCNPQ